MQLNQKQMKNYKNKFIELGSSACWDWKGAVTTAGYGIFRVYPYGTRAAHRLAWEMCHKKKIPDDTVIRHACSNKICVNPNHLVDGAR